MRNPRRLRTSHKIKSLTGDFFHIKVEINLTHIIGTLHVPLNQWNILQTSGYARIV